MVLHKKRLIEAVTRERYEFASVCDTEIDRSISVAPIPLISSVLHLMQGGDLGRHV